MLEQAPAKSILTTELTGMPNADVILATLAAFGEPTHDEKTFVHELASSQGQPPKDRQQIRLRGSFIASIITHPDVPALVGSRRIYIVSSVIEGPIDISYQRAHFALFIRNCKIEGGMILRGSQLSRLQIFKSQVGCINADRMRVSMDFDLADSAVSGQVLLNSTRVGGGLSLHRTTIQASQLGAALELQESFVKQNLTIEACNISGSTSLVGARVDGNLQCVGTQFLSAAADAFIADGVQVRRNALFRDSHSRGAMTIRGARILGNLEFDRAQLASATGQVLKADGVHCNGNVFLRDGFSARGEVSLIGARITGTLDIVDAQIASNDKFAITLDGSTVTGSVFLARSSFDGVVSMISVSVRGQVVARSATINSLNGDALVLNGTTIGTELLIDEGAAVEGTIRLAGARIGGIIVLDGNFRPGADDCWLDCAYARAKSVIVPTSSHVGGRASFHFARVRDVLCWQPSLAQHAVLDLTFAYTRKLLDRETSWPGHLCLELDGYSFKDIDEKSPRSLELRLDWLQRQGQHKGLSAYEELARLFDRIGDSTSASLIRIRHERLRRSGPTATRSSKVWSWIYRITVGYGYAPSRVIRMTVAFTCLGTILFWLANQAGIMQPATQSVGTSNDPEVSSSTTSFSAFAFALDSLLPIVDLRQEARWEIASDGRYPMLTTVVEVYYLLHVLAGWFLGVLLALAASAVVKQRT